MPNWKFPNRTFLMSVKGGSGYKVLRIVEEDEETITVDAETSSLFIVRVQLLKENIEDISYPAPSNFDEALERLVKE